MPSLSCRNCHAELTRVFVDLGTSPLSNSYVRADQLDEPEPHFPLRPYICDNCLLVQLPVFESPDRIFSDYAFFSGQSQTWVRHCEEFVATAAGRLPLSASRVLELASNDGTLLRALQRSDRGWTVAGVEPARNIARHALLRGIPTIDRFFGVKLAQEMAESGYRADLVVANNVLAHVPDLDDFIGGIKTILAPDGIVSIEVPSLVNLIEHNQFDTIYHEHFSYFTLHTLCNALRRRDLYPFDVEMVETHGGSLRLYAYSHEPRFRMSRLGHAERREANKLLTHRTPYLVYADKPPALKQRMLEILTALRHKGKRIAGYGAPAKATTFLSYCGIGPETVEFIVDSTPSKQGKYLPGVRIPILHPDALADREPDVILILSWNWRNEIHAKIKRDCPWEPTVLCRDQVLSPALAVA